MGGICEKQRAAETKGDHKDGEGGGEQKEEEKEMMLMVIVIFGKNYDKTHIIDTIE